jgi:sorbitol-specific phosphotransferase system component IIBC
MAYQPCMASLLSGIALSLGTAWGLFRHYWVCREAADHSLRDVVLLIYMGTFRQMAGVAADSVVNLEVVRNASPIVHSILALILLIVATVLRVYKPFGMTPFGARTADVQRSFPRPLRHSPLRLWSRLQHGGRTSSASLRSVSCCCSSSCTC